MPLKPATTAASRPLAAALVAGAVGVVGLLIVVPLVSVFYEAFARGTIDPEPLPEPSER